MRPGRESDFRPEKHYLDLGYEDAAERMYPGSVDNSVFYIGLEARSIQSGAHTKLLHV